MTPTASSSRPTPIRRFYRGGPAIAELRGIDVGGDHSPEEWVGSATTLFGEDERGLSRLPDGALSATPLTADPEAWLGADHAARFGASPALLVKLLDAGERLPVHVPPRPTLRPRAPRPALRQDRGVDRARREGRGEVAVGFARGRRRRHAARLGRRAGPRRAARRAQPAARERGRRRLRPRRRAPRDRRRASSSSSCRSRPTSRSCSSGTASASPTSGPPRSASAGTSPWAASSAAPATRRRCAARTRPARSVELLPEAAAAFFTARARRTGRRLAGAPARLRDPPRHRGRGAALGRRSTLTPRRQRCSCPMRRGPVSVDGDARGDRLPPARGVPAS